MAVIQLINRKRPQIAEILCIIRKSGLGNRMVMSDFNWKFVKSVSAHAQ